MTHLAAKSETVMGPLQWPDLPPAWLMVVLVGVGFLWIRSLYTRERGNARPWQRGLLTLLRVGALLAVLLILGAPFREEVRTAVEPSNLVVLIDTSRSMNLDETYPEEEARTLLDGAFPSASRPASLEGVSRGQLIKGFLGAEGDALLRSWKDRFVVHAFTFDSELQGLGSTAPLEAGVTDEEAEDPVQALGDRLRALTFDGNRTRIGSALRNIGNEFARRPDRHLAGVILLTDGRDTSDGEPPLETLAGLGGLAEQLRLVPVLVGNPASGRNIWVERIRAKDEVLVQDEVVFESGIRHTQFGGANVEVQMRVEQILTADGEELESPLLIDLQSWNAGSRRAVTRTDVILGDEDESQPVRFRSLFPDAGTFRITVEAILPPGIEDEDGVRSDNRRTHEIRVRDAKIKVLYVEGPPSWDWRFLSNHLTREPDETRAGGDRRAKNRFQVHVLLQSADPGYPNPRSPGLRPLTQFPQTKAELFAYDVVILGGVDWTQFNRNSRAEAEKLVDLLVEFVDQGGGLALQSNATAFTPQSFLGTRLTQLMPVTISNDDRNAWGRDEKYATPFRIELTDAGKAHPMFAVIPGTADEPIPSPELIAKTWRAGTELSESWLWYWMYRSVAGLKPGAIDLARARPVYDFDDTWLDDRNLPYVIFASMDYGRGRVWWSALDHLSHLRREHRDEFFGAFWEQIVRYLATYRLLGGNSRLKIFPDKDEYFVGETATITVLALNAQFEPLTAPTLEGVHIEDPEGNTIRLEGDQAPKSLAEEGQPGTYRFYLPLRKVGSEEESSYRIWIESRDGAARGSRVNDRAERRITVKFRATEMRERSPDLETLEALLQFGNPAEHKGRVLRLPELEEHVRTLEARTRERVLERNERPQWDKWWVLVAMTILLGLEWALRKRWRMI